MYLRVTKSPIELAEDFPMDEEAIEATRFMDERGQSMMELLRETSCELAQYQERCEILEKRLAKYEKVDEMVVQPYVHYTVEL